MSHYHSFPTILLLIPSIAYSPAVHNSDIHLCTFLSCICHFSLPRMSFPSHPAQVDSYSSFKTQSNVTFVVKFSLTYSEFATFSCCHLFLAPHPTNYIIMSCLHVRSPPLDCGSLKGRDPVLFIIGCSLASTVSDS